MSDNDSFNFGGDMGYPPPNFSNYEPQGYWYDPLEDTEFGSLFEPDWPYKELTDEDAPPILDSVGNPIEETGQTFFVASVDWTKAKLENLRGIMFTSAVDAIAYLTATGTITFSKLVRFNNGLFGLEIPPNTPELTPDDDVDESDG